MNLKKLEVFHIAAKCNSFSKAADMLLVTPSAVSIQIHDLENHYGVILFARSGNQVRLTDTGKALYAYTSRIFGLTERAESILLKTGNAAKSTLKVGAEETGAKYVLPIFISAFQKEFPDIKVIVKIGTSRDLVENLRNKENDLVLAGATKISNIRASMAVGKREVFLVVSKKHAFFSREEEIELQDLKRERIILSGEGTAIRHAVSRVFKKYNFRPEAYVESDSLDFIKAMLAENQAMAFLPYPPVRAEVKKGVFKTLRLSCGRIYLDLRVFFSRRDFLSPPAKRFVQIIKEGLM